MWAMSLEEPPPHLDELAHATIGAALEVHRHLGPGYLELLSYLRAGGFQLGLLINFNVPVLRQGIRRVIHSAPKTNPPEAYLGSSASWR